MKKTCFAAAPLALALLAAASAADAQTAPRAWVSGHGTDTAGCGAPVAPCRSLQYTHDNIVAAGGEIDILDPAGYGAITITKAISIINDGVGTAGVQATSGADAIQINAQPTDAVVLRGLNLEGLSSGFNGVKYTAGATLTIERCSISDFTSAGVQFAPSNVGDLYVFDTKIANVGLVGINVVPLITSGTGRVQATIERLAAINDTQAGVFVDGRESGSNIIVEAMVDGSVLSGSAAGVTSVGGGAGHATVFVMVRGSVLTKNTAGVVVDSGSTLDIGRSALSGNTEEAFFNDGASSLGSYGDNNVNGNNSLGATPTAVGFH